MVIVSLDIDGPQRPANVAALTGMSSGGVTKLLDRLEAQGLITREHSPIGGDRRAVKLALTPEGKAVADRMALSIAAQAGAVRDAIEELRAITDAQTSLVRRRPVD